MNIILIAVDTMRSDALSCYGNPRPTSPNVDELARQGVLFENFYSVGNCTHPGFTSMLTGMQPESSGIVSHWSRESLDEGTPTLAELLSGAGFTTAAIDNLYDGWRPDHPFYPWFRRGFDHYAYPERGGFYKDGLAVSRMASDWLSSDPREPFLLFIHYWDTHAPYNKAPKRFYRFYDGDPCDPRIESFPPGHIERYRRTFGMPITDPGYVVSAYHAEAAYVDWCIGKVVSRLRKLDLLEDSLLVVTSDHGDIMPFPRLALGRWWNFCHIGLYQDCLRIPLIVWGKGIEPGLRVGGRYQLVDLLPTVLDLAGIGGRRDVDGRSIAGELRGDGSGGRDQLFFSENTYQKQRAILSWPWEYMRMEAEYQSMPPRCLFNLAEDPWEMTNLSDAEPGTVERMDGLLDEYVSLTTRGRPDPIKTQDVTAKE
jgi:arylsulfatase